MDLEVAQMHLTLPIKKGAPKNMNEYLSQPLSNGLECFFVCEEIPDLFPPSMSNIKASDNRFKLRKLFKCTISLFVKTTFVFPKSRFLTSPYLKCFYSMILIACDCFTENVFFFSFSI